MSKTYYFDWQVNLPATPESLWPFVADTNRFNKDTGLPPITQITDVPDLTPGKYRLRFYLLGQKVEWEEAPFDWVYPYRFGVLRTYRSGPIKTMRVHAEMTALSQGGTHLRYQVWAEPANLLGHAAIGVQIGIISASRFMRVFQRYGELARSHQTPLDIPGKARLTSSGRERLRALRRRVPQSANRAVLEKLAHLLEYADDLSLQRLRPYQLADLWHLPRRTVLETFLQASHDGFLDVSWELLCPMCRGVGESVNSLSSVHNGAHCHFCNADYDVDFDRQVEVVFRPNPSIRPLPNNLTFCITGPQSMPHKPLNVRLEARQTLQTALLLEAGYYALNTSASDIPRSLLAEPQGQQRLELLINDSGLHQNAYSLAPQVFVHIHNDTDFPQMVWLERTAWRDDTATAADVTSLQVFRDLFSREALRAGQEIAVGRVTLMFTDLRDSTRMYRQVGDGPAFGRVRQHFEVLQQAIASEGGAVVKTMGDAVMAVFTQPDAALRAIRIAHSQIINTGGDPRLSLKVGIHTGACIAVTLNERLDYFGSTVNIAARLPGLAQGGEVVLSQEVFEDPGVQRWLQNAGAAPQPFAAEIKGFDTPFALLRLAL